jgi:hypothetical protein
LDDVVHLQCAGVVYKIVDGIAISGVRGGNGEKKRRHFRNANRSTRSNCANGMMRFNPAII